jgi:hypothetical protein
MARLALLASVISGPGDDTKMGAWSGRRAAFSGSHSLFLEEVYNAKRLCSSLGYVPVDEFEANYLKS